VGHFCITGCAGFIGARLSEALLDDGATVFGIDSVTPYYAQIIKERRLSRLEARDGFEFLRAPVETTDLKAAFDGVDGIYHLAAQPGVRSSWGESFETYARLNVLATQRVFAAASAHDIPVVFASSSSIYGDAEAYPTPETARPRPVSPYGVTKLACEHLAYAYAANFGLHVVGLRYFTIYGPGQRPDMAISKLITALLEGRPFEIYGSGEQSRDFTYVDDAVRATRAAMEGGRPGVMYNVGGGEEASLLDVIATCEELAGRELDRRLVAPVAGDATRTSADTALIRTQLGWHPLTTLRDGLAAQVDSAAVAARSPAVAPVPVGAAPDGVHP
jgi:UDP-glucuronate 4-epimerase